MRLMIENHRIIKAFLPLSFLLSLFVINSNANGLRAGQNSEETYSKLRLVFPDLNKDDIANKSILIRSIFDANEAQEYQGEFKINSVTDVWIKSEGKKRLILFVNVTAKGDEPQFTWGELNVVALYDVERTIRLLDVVDVSADRENGYWGKLEIHPDNDAFVFEHKHHNAGENFTAFTFVYIDNDKFKILFDGFPTLYYGRQCKAEIEETGVFGIVRNPRSSYRDIVFNIKVVGNSYGANCEIFRGRTTKNFSLRARWQNGKYQFADGGAELKRLRREEKRLGFGE